MRFVNSVSSPKERCFLALLLFQHLGMMAGQTQLSPGSHGKTVKGLVGSAVNFTWNFSGGSSGVKVFTWGLSNGGGDFIANGALVSLDGFGNPVNVRNFPADYSGRVAGRRIGDKFSGQVIFTLSSIKKTDEKSYACKLEPINLFDDRKFDAVNLEIQGPPSISQISANQTVNEGDDVTLICKGDGKPTPNITWTRLSDNSVVTFPLTVSKQDKGGYRCTADNGIGDPARKNVFITVQYKPEGVTISTGVAKNTVKQGQNVTFTCDLDDAFPAVSEYKFYLNGSISKVTNVNKFTIVGVKRSQHFGEYKCEARNAAGDEQSAGVRLNINEPPIITHPTAANASYNEQSFVNISCKAKGTPYPEVRWIHNGQVKSSGSKAAYLSFSSIAKEDAGMYTCRANNSLQTAEKKIIVVVNCKY